MQREQEIVKLVSDSFAPFLSLPYDQQNPPFPSSNSRSRTVASTEVTQLYFSLLQVENYAHSLRKSLIHAFVVDNSNFRGFPDELLVAIFQFMTPMELLKLKSVCIRWKRIIDETKIHHRLAFKITANGMNSEGPMFNLKIMGQNVPVRKRARHGGYYSLINCFIIHE